MPNALVVCFMWLYPIAFVLITSGYVVMARHVWKLPDRKARLNRLFFSSKDSVANYPPTGPALIGFGALCAVVGSVGLFIWVITLVVGRR